MEANDTANSMGSHSDAHYSLHQPYVQEAAMALVIR